MDAAVPLQQAHRLTFAAEAARPGGAAGGQDADALSGWDAAAGAWNHLGQPYPLAHALLRAAQAAMDCGDRDGAAERLARAAPLADGLGAGPLREQIGSLARRARLGVPAAGQPPELLGLTAREIQVLRLVATGCSNRDIAAELLSRARPPASTCRTSWPSSAPRAAPRPRPSLTGPASKPKAPERPPHAAMP